MSKRLYKIKRKSDGLFSSAGNYPTFNSKGKTWQGTSGVTLHLLNLGVDNVERFYKDCEVVSYVMVLNEQETESVTDYFDRKDEERDEKYTVEQERARNRKIKELENQIKKLKK